jgi:SCP-2 sterol transfer family
MHPYLGHGTTLTDTPTQGQLPMLLLSLITAALAFPLNAPWKLAIACQTLKFPSVHDNNDVVPYERMPVQVPNYCKVLLPTSFNRDLNLPVVRNLPDVSNLRDLPASNMSPAPAPNDPFKSAQIFQSNSKRLSSDPAVYKQFADIGAVFRIFLKSNGVKRSWVLNFRDGLAIISEFPANVEDVGVKVDANVETSDDDFLKLADGSLSGAWGYVTGRVKYSGPIGPGIKLNNLFAALRTSK